MTITTAQVVSDIAESMPTHVYFSSPEYADRRLRVQGAMAQRGIDCLLITRGEDQYWLSGFDSSAASVFHVLFFTSDGQILHLSRSADLANIAFTSQCRDVRVFDESYGNSRGEAIKDVLRHFVLAGKRVGVESDSLGMPLALYTELRGLLDGWCEIVDSSELIRELRRVKSVEELQYLRRAGEILNQASQAAIDLTRPGVFEGDLMGEFQRVVSSADGETFAGFPLGAGGRALLVRRVAGRGYVSENDQVLFEPAASYRHYCAASMFTVLTGPVIDPRYFSMHAACLEALHRVQDTIKPGNTFGDLYSAHRATVAEHGYNHAALNACGYSMGAVWTTGTWMEPPMIAANVPLVLEERMTIFTHMILTDRSAGLAMSLGETVEVGPDGPIAISTVPCEPIIK
ncbi:M24 family metallopeptidase [Nocardia sp. NPDC059246]|uniref:M24 family metallopeptidase n=1 Tax=unclassified Nocardia TaxID=2637762 RepID=UPI0036BCC7F2